MVMFFIVGLKQKLVFGINLSYIWETAQNLFVVLLLSKQSKVLD